MRDSVGEAEALPTQIVHVLLVEDDDDHAHLAHLALARAGPFSIDRVASGADALRRLADHTYDALVLDYRLGDTDGLDVLRQLRAVGTATPALLLTSQGSEDVASVALRAHADDYLSKKLGFVEDQLGCTVLAMLERRRLADTLLRAREEFLTAASHDLKSPLAVIKANAQLLQRRLQKASAPPTTTRPDPPQRQKQQGG